MKRGVCSTKPQAVPEHTDLTHEEKNVLKYNKGLLKYNKCNATPYKRSKIKYFCYACVCLNDSHKRKALCKSRNGESGNVMRGTVVKRGISLTNQGDGNVGNQGENGWWECGNQGGNAGNQGGSAENRAYIERNQGKNLSIGVELMKQKLWRGINIKEMSVFIKN